MKSFRIKTNKGERLIGNGQPIFIVAEMSGNHNQSMGRALELIDVAAEAGVDAIKLQTYTPDTITIDSDKEYFRVQMEGAWRGQTLYNLYKQAYTPWEWHPKLKEYAESKGLIFFSTPFDETAVDFLEELNVEIYKVASFEVVDIPLLKKVGKTGKPVIMSRGMATLEEIELAIDTLCVAGTKQIAVLHCVSSYPASPEQMNLSTIVDLAKRFEVVSGLSDHTLGINVPLVAVGLGAKIIEKHFTLKRTDGGTDSAFSLERVELKQLVKSVREAEAAIGEPCYGVSNSEKSAVLYRRSLFVVKDIKKGEELTTVNVRSIRPANGLPPKYLDKVIGMIAKRDIERGTPLNWNLIGEKR